MTYYILKYIVRQQYLSYFGTREILDKLNRIDTQNNMKIYLTLKVVFQLAGIYSINELDTLFSNLEKINVDFPFIPFTKITSKFIKEWLKSKNIK